MHVVNSIYSDILSNHCSYGEACEFYWLGRSVSLSDCFMVKKAALPLLPSHTISLRTSQDSTTYLFPQQMAGTKWKHPWNLEASMDEENSWIAWYSWHCSHTSILQLKKTKRRTLDSQAHISASTHGLSWSRKFNYIFDLSSKTWRQTASLVMNVYLVMDLNFIQCSI